MILSNKNDGPNQCGNKKVVSHSDHLWHGQWDLFRYQDHIWFEFHESGIMFNDGGKATHGKYKSVSDG